MAKHKVPNQETVRISELRTMLNSCTNSTTEAQEAIIDQSSKTDDAIAQCKDALEDLVAKNIPLYDDAIAQIIKDERIDPLSDVLKDAKKRQQEIASKRSRLSKSMQQNGIRNYTVLKNEREMLNLDKDRLNKELNHIINYERPILLNDNQSWLDPILEFNQDHPNTPITSTADNLGHPKAKGIKHIFKTLCDPTYRGAQAAIKLIKTKDGILDPELVNVLQVLETYDRLEAQKNKQFKKINETLNPLNVYAESYQELEVAEIAIQKGLSSDKLLPVLQKSVIQALTKRNLFETLTSDWTKDDTIQALTHITQRTALLKMRNYLDEEKDKLQDQQSNLKTQIKKCDNALKTSRGKTATVSVNKTQLERAALITKCKGAYTARNATALRQSINTYSARNHYYDTSLSRSSDPYSLYMLMWIMTDQSHNEGAPPQALDPAFLRDALDTSSLTQNKSSLFSDSFSESSVFSDLKNIESATPNFIPDLHDIAQATDSSIPDFMTEISSSFLSEMKSPDTSSLFKDTSADLFTPNTKGNDPFSDFSFGGSSIPSLDIAEIKTPDFSIPDTFIPDTSIGGDWSGGDWSGGGGCDGCSYGGD